MAAKRQLANERVLIMEIHPARPEIDGPVGPGRSPWHRKLI